MTNKDTASLMERLRYTAQHGIFIACDKGMLATMDEALDHIQQLEDALRLALDTHDVSYEWEGAARAALGETK